ncbi:MAG: chemotaxis response regulator protein-glutamate methylesterase [Pirellulaceae bacterium]|nr:chemotaxis response regulator protein-glutamate methylesterase [Planctomycetales bacterium]MCA9218679.1 chemotaxis response regulator protein-glutamate methylesterase [Planctomycetales bacterium]
MSNTIRVMICDDSAVMRRILTTVLSEDAELEIVYAAQHGRDALDNLDQAKPDVVVLDVEMPVMDGIQTVAAIRRKHRTLPIVMFSSLTSRGAEATFEALSAGANDFATKPSGVGHLGQAVDIVRKDLLAKIKGLVHARRRLSAVGNSRITLSPAVTRPAKSGGPISLVAVGVSTGGPKALSEILPCLPVDLPVPVLIVQHMPAVFTGLLASRLDAISSLSVKEAEDGEMIRPGGVWIARGDWHMEVSRFGTDTRISLNQNEPENSVRPAVDPLFRSVARVFRDRALGVILTGMGKDGLDGCRAMRQQGASIVAQDQATCAVYGMPRQVIEAGFAESVLPLEQIADEITRRVRCGSARSLAASR